jgi:hypothetical protein
VINPEEASSIEAYDPTGAGSYGIRRLWPFDPLQSVALRQVAPQSNAL